MSVDPTDAVVEGRRNTDMASAIAIAELRVEMRALTQTVANGYQGLTESLKVLRIEQVDNRSRYDELQGAIRTEVRLELLETKREISEDFKEHTHNDLAPHQGTLGRRLGSLETSRTYVLGALGVASLFIPVATALVIKWFGG